jgi:hypothetical protein
MTGSEQALRSIERIDDLLTDDEREQLRADLAEIARLRRKAIDTARDWPMP